MKPETVTINISFGSVAAERGGKRSLAPIFAKAAQYQRVTAKFLSVENGYEIVVPLSPLPLICDIGDAGVASNMLGML